MESQENKFSDDDPSSKSLIQSSDEKVKIAPSSSQEFYSEG